LEECGAEYEKVIVDLQDKPQEFVDLYAKANPLPGARAKVPLLEVVDGNFYVCESLVVAEYVAERFASSSDDDGLLPAEAEGRAVARLFTELCGSSFSYFSLLSAKDDDLRQAVKSFQEGLASVDAFLKELGDDDGPFLFGNRFSLAECNAAPFVLRACTILPEFTGDDCPVNPLDMCDELGLVRLKQWMEAVLSRPSVIATGIPKEDMIKGIKMKMERFAAMDKLN